MELDSRKIMILKAVIRNYMETGEPVGSRTISKLPECSFSSATIRNEMCDLEDMGYLIQPHTSAGRIPSDKGYRFYVDEILREKQTEVEEMKELMLQRVDRLELVLKRMAKLIASNTNYAAMISGPSAHQAKIKLLQLSRMDEKRMLVVIVVEGNRDEPEKDVDMSHILTMVKEAMECGMSKSEAVKEVAKKTGVPKNRIYDLVHGRQEGEPRVC